MASILIVDDDVELCRLVGEYLRERGFSVDAVHDGSAGFARAMSERHDLLILDAMLPVLDGLELLAQLRRRSNVAVIMLTARAGRQDRIDGLNAGADDYLPKPFDPGELIARVDAVLRRVGARVPIRPEVEVGSFSVNTGDRQIRLDGRPLALTSTEFDMLDLLIRAAGRTVTRDEIATVIYHRESSPYQRNIDVHVSRLRRKLDAAGKNPIRTVWGSGYMFSPR